jgi:hypothetical protein
LTETGLKLRTGCPNGDWRSFVVSAESGGVHRGDMDQIHDTVGVYAQDADHDDDVAFIYHAEKIVVPKDHGTGASEFDIGDKVYYDATAHSVTSTHGNNLWIGIALEHVEHDDEEVMIDLFGNKAD